MRISIFGLGYVGCVGLGCLSELSHSMIGVDIDPEKVTLINSGKATIVEKDIDELIGKNIKKGSIRATTNSIEAVAGSDVAIVCVGTPNDPKGHLEISHVLSVAREIGRGIRKKTTFFTVAIRSTVMPGTNKHLSETIAEESGKRSGIDFAVVSNPEFLREGSAVNDFFNPPYTVLASDSTRGIEVMRDVYSRINTELIVTDIGTAELIKFVNNSYHGLKVTFANEIGRISKAIGADSRALMDLFVRDTVLNISANYFKPGFAYGGSCLTKDLRALNAIGHDEYLKLPVLSAIETSNQVHIEHALEIIMSKKKKKIGFYGISFKAGTDDLRFSPALELAERLLGKGYEIKVYDRHLNVSRLMGKNKAFIYEKMPHINEILIEQLDVFLQAVDLVVLVNRDRDFDEMLKLAPSKLAVVDLIGAAIQKPHSDDYDGICW